MNLIRRFAVITVAFAAFVANFSSARAVAPSLPKPDFDARLPREPSELAGFILRRPEFAQAVAASELEAAISGLTLRWDGMSGSPKWIAASSGARLAPASAGKPEEAAHSFLRSQAVLFGLDPAAVDSLRLSAVMPRSNGTSHAYFTQIAHGLEVFGGRAVVNLGADGSVRSVGSSLYAGAPQPPRPALAAADAFRLAVRDVYPSLVPDLTAVVEELGPEQRTIFSGAEFAHEPVARLLLFPERIGFRLVWEVRLAAIDELSSYEILVDAMDGHILSRQNVLVHAAARRLNGAGPDPSGEEIAPVNYSLATVPSSTPTSPTGWISGTGTVLAGNNASGRMQHRTEGPLADPDGSYDEPFNTLASAVVNAWWWVNDAHDRFYEAGFDEAAGNFQQDNFGNGGIGGDPMRVVAYANGGRTNAFYSPSVDGAIASVGFFWSGCTSCQDHDGYPENGGDRTTAFDRSVIIHEFAHGVTTRMVGGPAVIDCLRGRQSGAMGEGWSDLFVATFYGDLREGDYFFEGNAVTRDIRHDLAYDEMCKVVSNAGACSVHSDGQIWAGALWDLYSSLLALDPANGAATFHRLTVDALASTACYPTMLDGRDGILDADAALFGSTHHRAIWNAFAGRGMGQNASSTGENDSAPVPGYSVPASFTCSPPATPTGLTLSVPSANAIRLAYSAPGAAALEIWRDDFDNTFDRAVRVGFTTNTSTYTDTTVAGGKTYRYHLVALGSGGIGCRSGNSSTAQTTATGSCDAFPVFSPALAVSESGSGCGLNLSWTAASPGCPSNPKPILYSIYRGTTAGFEPSQRNAIGTSSATTFQDTPPQDGRVYYYLVLAQHGTVGDAPDARDRSSSQVLRWVPRIPTTGRTQVQFWNFESGAQGWTAQNVLDPNGGWTRLSGPHATYYGGALLNPDECAGGTGFCWVTGDAATSTSITERDSDGANLLRSPTWDGRNGAMLLSFDYWMYGGYFDSLTAQVTNGSSTVDIPAIELMTAQRFDAPGRFGWQRAELDLSSFITATSSMRVTFFPAVGNAINEFGIDNVRVDRATVCARSGLEIQSVAVDDSTPGWGNGNGRLDPGETAILRVTLVNRGASSATTPTGELRLVNPAGIVHDAASSFPSIASQATAASTDSGFVISVPHAVSCGDTLGLDFEFIDANGTKSLVNWSPETGVSTTETVLADDFETDLGWIVEGAGAGQGVWQRGDPVGTTVGTSAANPENDSPLDPGNQCYVTENGTIGGLAGATDVDAVKPVLHSPLLDLSPYKRARVKWQGWYFDDSASEQFEDYWSLGVFVDEGVRGSFDFYPFYDPTVGWVAMEVDLTPLVAMVDNVRVHFQALDRDATLSSGGLDHNVEAGVDRVRVEGDRFTCDLSAIDPPNGIAGTLRVSKSTSSVELTWNAPPADASHDPAAYFKVFESSSPMSGFAVTVSSMATSASRSRDLVTTFYRVTAINAGGTSGDEPTP